MNLFLIGQLTTALLLVLLILVQHKSAGVSGVFGGEGAVSFKKRGPEKLLHILTMFAAIVFGIFSLLAIR